MLSRAATIALPPREVHRLRVGTREARQFDQSQLISGELFRDALERERKRADRFEEAFVVLLVSLDRRRLDMVSLTRILEALSQSQPGADVIGWFEQGSVLGLIRSVEAREPGDAATALANTFRRELARCLSPEQADCCTIRCEAYSSRSDAVSPLIFAADSHHSARKVAGAAAKRLLDVIGSVCGLILFAPVFLCVAAIVKWTSKGPVFFRQQRVGAAGRPFTMF